MKKTCAASPSNGQSVCYRKHLTQVSRTSIKSRASISQQQKRSHVTHHYKSIHIPSEEPTPRERWGYKPSSRSTGDHTVPLHQTYTCRDSHFFLRAETPDYSSDNQKQTPESRPTKSTISLMIHQPQTIRIELKQQLVSIVTY